MAVSRFEEALRVIELLWSADGPVDFDGTFFRLHGARLDAELFEGRPPPIWIGANGPRMLALAGRHADGWWPTGSDGPEEYAAKLAVVRRSAEEAGRDPLAIVPAKMVVCLLGEPDELREALERPLVRSLALQLTAESLRVRGYDHPMGDRWRGIQDIEPGKLSRARLLRLFDEVDADAILSVVPHGTPEEVAREIAALHEAGLRIASILDYSGMAGQEFAARSAAEGAGDGGCDVAVDRSGPMSDAAQLLAVDGLFARAEDETGLSRLRGRHPARAGRDRRGRRPGEPARRRRRGRGRRDDPLAPHHPPGVLRGPEAPPDRRGEGRPTGVRDR